MADETTYGKGPPAFHAGVEYSQFLNQLSRKMNIKRYLEIGVNEGRLMSEIKADISVGVDPYYIIKENICKDKQSVILFQDTSDAYFRDPAKVGLLGGAPDLSFLDGLHTFDCLLRDFYNTEAISDTHSLIGMHDCLPLNSAMAERSPETAREKGEGHGFPGWWTGDVWKIVPILREYRPDLRVMLIDCPPTGLVLVSGLDPSSKILKENYLSIVDKYKDIAGDQNSIEEYYKSSVIVRSVDILHEFDFSLYLRS